MQPLTRAILLKTIINPSLTYGCEIWCDVSQTSIQKLERNQRYGARRCTGFPQNSPTAITTPSLDIEDVWCNVEKRKLIFLISYATLLLLLCGKLCLFYVFVLLYLSLDQSN